MRIIRAAPEKSRVLAREHETGSDPGDPREGTPQPVSFRRLTSWKGWFYGGMLPLLRRIPPERADAALIELGRLACAWPPRGRRLARSIGRARRVLGAGWEERAVRADLIDNLARYAARDNLLGDLTDAELSARFDVSGFEAVTSSLFAGRGAILLGCHFGGYLAAVHWLFRQRVPMRLLVQRPRHVSAWLHRQFDRDDGPFPQREFFLHTSMPPIEAARRTLRARDALRAGQAVFLNGDIPWPSSNARTGRLLGRSQSFLAVWADLSVLLRVPVIPLFCTHLPGGRFSLQFDPPEVVRPGCEEDAVAFYLARLEAVIAAHPADAIPHLTWDAYRPLAESVPSLPRPRLAATGRVEAPGPAPAPGRPLKVPAGTG
jgi:lauroyl/myristoyl acyltransferase